MHNLHERLKGPRLRTPTWLGGILILALTLSACGFTDEVGTNFNIIFESDLENSAAGLGLLQFGEIARVTFEVKEAGQEARNRTAGATFRLTSKSADDTPAHFNFVESSDLITRPFHTVSTFVYDVQASICATYNGPEVIGDPVDVCRTVFTMAEEDYEE